MKKKLVIEDDEIAEDSVSSVVTLRENGVDDCLIVANDENGKTYLGTVSIGQEVRLSYKWADGDDQWVEVFRGKVVELNPQLSMGGELCSVRAYGYAYALKNMRVKQEYGSESSNMKVTSEEDIEWEEWYQANGWGATPTIFGPFDYYFSKVIECPENQSIIFNKACAYHGGAGGVVIQYRWGLDEHWSDYVQMGTEIVGDTYACRFAGVDEEDYIIGAPNYDLEIRWKLRIPIPFTTGQYSTFRIYYDFTDTMDFMKYRTLREILCDLQGGILPQYVNKMLGLGIPSGYDINGDFVYDATPIFKYLYFPYESAFDCLMDIIELLGALTYPNAGPHWIVNATGELMIAPIGHHDVYGLLTPVPHHIETHWKTMARITPLEVGKHMILEDFVREEPEANYVIAAGVFEYPINEQATESSEVEWDTDHHYPAYLHGGAKIPPYLDGTKKRVGNFSLLKKWVTFTDYLSSWWFPKDTALGMNIMRIGTKDNIPSIKFYLMHNNLTYGAQSDLEIRLYTGAPADGNYFVMKNMDVLFPDQSVWNLVEFDLGPYGTTEWETEGTPSWEQIDHIGFFARFDIGGEVRVDGLGIYGSVIRAAYHGVSIGTYGCKMKVIKDSLARTDTLNPDDDSSLLGQRLKAELLRSMHPLLHGKIVIELDPRIKAGQLIHIHAGITDDAENFPTGFKIDQDFRIVEVQHTFSIAGATTILTLIDDLLNSIPIGPISAYTALIRSTSPDFQDRTFASLKATKEFDINMIILAKDYGPSEPSE